VNIKRSPLEAPWHDTTTGKDSKGNPQTGSRSADYKAGDSSFWGTYKEVDTVVDKTTGESRVDFSEEVEGSVSWTPPPEVVPPGYVYHPEPKLSGYAKIIGPYPEYDLTSAHFSTGVDWVPPGRDLLGLSHYPNGIKTWINKPLVFPDLKKVHELLGLSGTWAGELYVYAALGTGHGDLLVKYEYEYRPEVTVASAPPLPQEPPKPPQKPVTPTRPKTAPAPASVSTPEVTPQPPVRPVAPTRTEPAPTPASVSTPEVTPKPPERPTPPTPIAKPKPPVATTPPQKSSSAEQRFEVYNLGEGMNILQSADKPRGTLNVGGGKLRYQEAGKSVFAVGRGEITEIDANTVLGYDTGTFHVILKSGKTYNFAPASLSVADGQKMLESIKHALP
jgi:hypothetical protein